jgi:DNA-binding PadR family transcriptional regulator
MSKPPPQEEIPLTEATFYILLSLAAEPRHGYAIMKDVEALSKERVVLSTGTLYGAVKRLLEQGWIVRADEDRAPGEGSGRPRKVYSLTEHGKRILHAELSRLENLVTTANLRVSEGEA